MKESISAHPEAAPDGKAGLTASREIVVILLTGTLLSLLLVLRSEPGGDQLNLLVRGWLLVGHGTFIAYGNPTSMGGFSPGGMTTVLVALPLYLRPYPRSPAVRQGGDARARPRDSPHAP
jgi:hypothetical protein